MRWKSPLSKYLCREESRAMELVVENESAPPTVAKTRSRMVGPRQIERSIQKGAAALEDIEVIEWGIRWAWVSDSLRKVMGQR